MHGSRKKDLHRFWRSCFRLYRIVCPYNRLALAIAIICENVLFFKAPHKFESGLHTDFRQQADWKSGRRSMAVSRRQFAIANFTNFKPRYIIFTNLMDAYIAACKIATDCFQPLWRWSFLLKVGISHSTFGYPLLSPCDLPSGFRDHAVGRWRYFTIVSLWRKIATAIQLRGTCDLAIRFVCKISLRDACYTACKRLADFFHEIKPL